MLPQPAWVAACSGNKPNGLLYDALLAESPVGMFPFREASGTVLHDVSTFANHGTIAATGNTLASIAGPDGHSYPTIASTGGGQASHLAEYGIANGGGLTLVFVTHDTGGKYYVAKATYATTANTEWIASCAAAVDGAVADVTNGATLARRAFGFTGTTDNQWNLIIIRFPSTSSTPLIRANGSNIVSGSTGSGTGLTGTAVLQIGRYQSSLGHAGSVGLVALFAGSKSNGWCMALEAIADTEGWF